MTVVSATLLTATSALIDPQGGYRTESRLPGVPVQYTTFVAQTGRDPTSLIACPHIPTVFSCFFAKSLL